MTDEQLKDVLKCVQERDEYKARAERAERERENWKSTAEEAHYRMVLARRALSVGVDINPSDVARIDALTRAAEAAKEKP